ncbi:MAG TPA: ATP-binding cassette domain-containing protein [Actinomycetota bacterium]|nr:ATP-binding cassette domain-containing protein [Actinomycetota bacterium]
MTSTPPAIEVRGLTKRYGSVTAVDDLSFSVAAGRVTGFLGPNGAGKTTTMRILLGLARADGGEARVLGRLYRGLDAPVRSVGAALEITGFHPGRTARSHLRVAATQAGLADPSAIATTALTRVGLDEAADRRVGGFSAGMRQRLALASALIGDPSVLVLDEPSNGLDPAGVAWLRRFLRHFASQGGAVLVSSHLLAEVAQTVDELVVIDRGRFVTSGPVDDIVGALGAAVVVRSPERERFRVLLEEHGAQVGVASDGSLSVTGTSIESVGELAAAHAVVLHELRRSGATLEEAFLHLTGGRDDAPTSPARPGDAS